MSGVAIDSEGQVWGATGSAVAKFDNTGTFLGSAPADGAYGVAIGHDGDPRVISYNTAYKVAAGPKGGPPGAVTPYYTGLLNNQLVGSNYTYTDFTGFGALNVTVKKGEWTVIHDGGADDITWSEVLSNLRAGGQDPGRHEPHLPAARGQWCRPTSRRPRGWRSRAPRRWCRSRVASTSCARACRSPPDVEDSPVLSDVCVTRAM